LIICFRQQGIYEPLIEEEVNLGAKIENRFAIQGYTLDEKDFAKIKNLDYQLRDVQMSIAREKQFIENHKTQREGLEGQSNLKRT